MKWSQCPKIESSKLCVSSNVNDVRKKTFDYRHAYIRINFYGDLKNTNEPNQWLNCSRTCQLLVGAVVVFVVGSMTHELNFNTFRCYWWKTETVRSIEKTRNRRKKSANTFSSTQQFCYVYLLKYVVMPTQSLKCMLLHGNWDAF